VHSTPGGGGTGTLQSGQSYFVDATGAEESLAQPGLSVAVNAKGEVCGVVKVGRSSLDAATLHEMLQVSQRLATQLHAAVDAHVAIDS
jgi:exosome complex RNA-binding protein Rrp42 (RNase PH superfamily)